MKLNNKLLAIAKGISVWWGIYLILGCCAGFAVKTIQDIFIDDKQFRIVLYIPFMCGGSLLLAVITYFVTSFLKRIPQKKLRRKLVNIYKTGGFSADYINLLFENAKGDLKNLMYIEAAAAYCLKGETDTAAATLAKADLTAILDSAQSTGEFGTAAYYYCVKMASCIIAKDAAGAAQAYDEGIYYLDAFSGSDIVMTVLALYQTEGQLYNSAIETAKKIKWRSLPRSVRKYGRSFSLLIKAKNLMGMEKYAEAKDTALDSLENSCTEYMRSMAEEIIKKAAEAINEAEEKGSVSESDTQE